VDNVVAESNESDNNASFALNITPGTTSVTSKPGELQLHAELGELRFDPFRDGAEIVPVGFVHAIRRRAYAASQAVRAH